MRVNRCIYYYILCIYYYIYIIYIYVYIYINIYIYTKISPKTSKAIEASRSEGLTFPLKFCLFKPSLSFEFLNTKPGVQKTLGEVGLGDTFVVVSGPKYHSGFVVDFNHPLYDYLLNFWRFNHVQNEICWVLLEG